MTPSFEVQLQGIRLERGGRTVLHDVDLHILPGQRWVLAGANGAGKTQLLKLLAGDVWPTPSEKGSRLYRWGGESWPSPYEVKNEIAYLGAERQDKYEHYDWNYRVEQIVGTGLYRTDIPLDRLTAADRKRIAALLQRGGIAALARRRFLTLSYGERRLTLLTRALAWRPQLLLLDELLNGLDAHYRARVLRWLESTARSKLSWVLSTHYKEDIPRAATHALILERGRVAYRGPIERAPLARTLDARRRSRSAKLHATAPGPVLIRLASASVYLAGAHVLQSLSFEVRAGECWVVHGANGSGKSTLLRALYGNHAIAGAVQRAGIEPGVPLARFKRWVGWVAPQLQTDHPLRLTAAEVVQSGRHSSVGLNNAPTAADRAAARRALGFFGLTPLAGRTLRELSYGQVRRVLFARAWAGAPRLLLLDEPFAGLDAATRAAVLEDIEALLREGVTIMMATHHRNEWPAGATHELALRGGRAVYCGPVR